MKIAPDRSTGTVIVTLTAREAIAVAEKLVKAAVQSTPGVDRDRERERLDEEARR
jgi:hypothetical protein